MISFDYAKEVSPKKRSQPQAQIDVALHRAEAISVTAEVRRALTCYVAIRCLRSLSLCFMCPGLCFLCVCFFVSAKASLAQSKVREYYLCCVWSAHPEPRNRPGQPSCIPPSGNENSLSLVSGCRCGCGLQWAELMGPVSL